MPASGYLLIALGCAVVAVLCFRQQRAACRTRDELLARGVPESTRANAVAAPRDLLLAAWATVAVGVVVALIGLVKVLF